jgi:hypothetical protein
LKKVWETLLYTTTKLPIPSQGRIELQRWLHVTVALEVTVWVMGLCFDLYIVTDGQMLLLTGGMLSMVL